MQILGRGGNREQKDSYEDANWHVGIHHTIDYFSVGMAAASGICRY